MTVEFEFYCTKNRIASEAAHVPLRKLTDMFNESDNF
jgi:hypothetical protein